MIPWARIFITTVGAWLAIVRLIESRERQIARALGGSTATQREEESHALASLKAAA